MTSRELAQWCRANLGPHYFSLGQNTIRYDSGIDVLNTVNMLRDRGILVRSLSDGIDPATSTGRLMLNMLATLAEYERELIVERINAGIAASKQSGTKFGRPAVNPKVVADKLAIATDARAKGRTAEEAARLVGWSRSTLYRHQQALAIAQSSALQSAP